MADKLSDMETVNAFWVLLKQQKREVREVLEARLSASLRPDKPLKADESANVDDAPKKEEGQKGCYVPSKEAMDFVSKLSVKGGEKVPADEKGLFALLNEKY